MASANVALVVAIGFLVLNLAGAFGDNLTAMSTLADFLLHIAPWF